LDLINFLFFLIINIFIMMVVPVHPISPTSLRSRGQAKFIYSYLPPPFEAPFKDKTVTKLKRSKTDNTSGTWWLFLTMDVNLGQNQNNGDYYSKHVKRCKICVCYPWYYEKELLILDIECWNTFRCNESW